MGPLKVSVRKVAWSLAGWSFSRWGARQEDSFSPRLPLQLRSDRAWGLGTGDWGPGAVFTYQAAAGGRSLPSSPGGTGSQDAGQPTLRRHCRSRQGQRAGLPNGGASRVAASKLGVGVGDPNAPGVSSYPQTDFPLNSRWALPFPALRGPAPELRLLP